MSLADYEVRRRIREDLDSTLVVEAAAGTGKTTALVSRLIALIKTDRAKLDRIVAVTFTEKAAGEMKLRLREAVENARNERGIRATERRLLDEALEHFEVAHITTIHAFAAELLRERPVESKIDPGFEMSGDDSARQLLDEAFEVWFQSVLEAPPEGVRRFLRRRPRGRQGEPPRERLRHAAWNLAQHRDFSEPWRRDAFDLRTAVDSVMDTLEKVGQLGVHARRQEDYLAQSLATIARFSSETKRREEAQGYRDYDGLAAELSAMRRDAKVGRHWTKWNGSPWKFGPKLETVRASRDAARAQLDAFLEAEEADLAPCLERELRAVIATYEQLKLKAGRLDFLDLLLRARDLVRDHAAVRRDLQQRFSHVLVDEFQDTDPLQAEILLLLAADDSEERDWRRVRPVVGKFFAVGDPKQAIYRFRRADVALYESIKHTLVSQGATLVNLSASFRAVPSIQAAVNAAFAPVMRSSAGGQPDYVPLQPVREESIGQPTVVVLPVPRPYYYREVTRRAVEESLPDAVAAFVDWLLASSGWEVTERAGPTQRVRVEPRHVCILFKRFQGWDDMTRPYVRALEARRIPHVLVGGKSFHDREEVLALRNALQAIERPSDELAVFGTLRGPLFALSDDALVAYRHEVGRPHPLRRVDLERLSAGARDVAEALDVLGTLHVDRHQRPIADTISRLLATTRAQAGIAIWPAGEQALANVLRVMDLARRHEAAGTTSFRDFVDRLADAADSGAATDAPVVEEGTEGVRMMTVHKAKGLEFPVVILADISAQPTRDRPSRHVDQESGLWVETLCDCAPPELLENAPAELQRDAEEAVRLTYVAATRARDLLVVPAVGDEELLPSWVETLHPVIYPAQKRGAAPAKGCPIFGPDSVKERPSDCPRSSSDSVAPGLHQPRVGTHGVVWWDPHVLELDKDPALGLRQQRLLQADDAGVGDEGIRSHDTWRAGRQAALTGAQQPRLVVRRATEIPASSTGTETVVVERTSLDRAGRPGGRRFGALVHAVLAVVDLSATDRDQIRLVVDGQRRVVGTSPGELEAATDAIAAALAHPLMRLAAAGTEVLRETPLVLRLADGSLAEGTLDLAFRDGDCWRVIDFKTDAEFEKYKVRYESQVRLYALALGEATRTPARATILLV